jgi:hypothetical protein
MVQSGSTAGIVRPFPAPSLFGLRRSLLGVLRFPARLEAAPRNLLT